MVCFQIPTVAWCGVSQVCVTSFLNSLLSADLAKFGLLLFIWHQTRNLMSQVFTQMSLLILQKFDKLSSTKKFKHWLLVTHSYFK